ncbi:glycosyltransferase [Lewinella cohaerens]|uniref:glycosyltransferase n=1 Tax=Lewinella cohaerens TaxID=70995 RepID=UPI00037AC515|nr:glycosyltransferase [Lewinella cohaerens]
MDICFLPAWFYDIENKGGGLFFREQAIAIQSVAERCSIFYPALGFSYLGKENWEEQTSEEVTTFKYQGFCFPKRLTNLQFLYNYKIKKAFSLFLASRKGRLPDLIHAHSLWGAYAALIIKREWGIPFVYTEHLGKWTAATYSLPRHQLQQLLAIVKTANLVTAVSNTLAQRMRGICSTESILVTPNMVDTDFFTPLASTDDKQPYTFHIISIGDPWYTKGLDLLIEAVGIAQQQTKVRLQLTLVDNIPKRQQLYPLIKKHQLENQVKFAGRLERDVLRGLLQQQDVLVSASRRESFGLTMIEAMACGVPVIATKTAGALDIIQPKNGTLIDINNSHALADGILALLRRPNSSPPQELAAYAHHKYGRQAFCERWLHHYETILGERKSTRP